MPSGMEILCGRRQARVRPRSISGHATVQARPIVCGYVVTLQGIPQCRVCCSALADCWPWL